MEGVTVVGGVTVGGVTNDVLVVNKLVITRNEGRLAGSTCQHAFIILDTTDGQPLGVGILYPLLILDTTFQEHNYIK